MSSSELLLLAQIIVAVITGYVLLRKVKPEEQKLMAEGKKIGADEKKSSADALDVTAGAATKSMDLFTKAMDEIEDLRKQQEALEIKIDDLEKTLKQAARERNAAFNWAARLIRQMKEAKPDIEPVGYIAPQDTESSIQAIKMGKPTDGA